MRPSNKYNSAIALIFKELCRKYGHKPIELDKLDLQNLITRTLEEEEIIINEQYTFMEDKWDIIGFTFKYHPDTEYNDAFMNSMCTGYYDPVRILCAFNFVFNEGKDTHTLEITCVTTNHTKYAQRLK